MSNPVNPSTLGRAAYARAVLNSTPNTEVARQQLGLSSAAENRATFIASSLKR